MKMKSIFIITIILATFLSAQQRHSAIVLKARGDAKLIAKDSDDAMKLKKGKLLDSGDKIITGEKTFVAIKFLDDASLLRVRSNSELVVRGEWDDEGNQDKSIWLQLGELWAGISRQKSTFEVATPTAVASVKGTKFWSMQYADGHSLFVGEEGMVEIKNEHGTILMRKGQTTTVPGKGAPPVVTRTQPGDTPPPDQGDDENRYELEIEFNNDQNMQKTLIINLEK